MVELHEPVSERIGKILRENREAQGLTRQQLSEKSTVSDRQISAIELGEKGPSMNSLELALAQPRPFRRPDILSGADRD